MLGFEVCTPQRDMKDKQVRQKKKHGQYFRQYFSTSR